MQKVRSQTKMFIFTKQRRDFLGSEIQEENASNQKEIESFIINNQEST